jgi:TRAP-type uncharacterized transport system fused permease subunit
MERKIRVLIGKVGLDGHEVGARRLAFPAYIVPFIFVYHPVLLMKGSPFDRSYQFLMSCVGVAAMSLALVGNSYYGNIKWSIPSRLLIAASFFGFIIPGWESDIWAVIAVGIGILLNPRARSMIVEAVTSPSSNYGATSRNRESDRRKG